ncbi:hypothetical protein C1H46_023263 [Malus baccata]|uniref:Transmembrane protein n=1 Tax=Malus baccata TaxID=106549 RepID=A0A540LXD1_MALBA|nr:hypothetical protein C1H46_023263 [Malus baccata]
MKTIDCHIPEVIVVRNHSNSSNNSKKVTRNITFTKNLKLSFHQTCNVQECTRQLLPIHSIPPIRSFNSLHHYSTTFFFHSLHADFLPSSSIDRLRFDLLLTNTRNQKLQVFQDRKMHVVKVIIVVVVMFASMFFHCGGDHCGGGDVHINVFPLWRLY